MLQPRETDIPALFFVLVVLPLVAYVLLGKWSETAKKKEKLNLLAYQAAEEAFRAETMAAGAVTPVVPLPNKSTHQCAWCYGPATTRCSQCKSLRYCSGKCQIIHWRQVHRLECRPLGNDCSSSTTKAVLPEECCEKFSSNGESDLHCYEDNVEHPNLEKIPLDGVFSPPESMQAFDTAACMSTVSSIPSPMKGGRSSDKRALHKSKRDLLKRRDISLSEGFDMATGSWVASSSTATTKETPLKHKLRESESTVSTLVSSVANGSNYASIPEESHPLRSKRQNASRTRSSDDVSNSLDFANKWRDACATQLGSVTGESFLCEGIVLNHGTGEFGNSSENTATKRSSKSKVTFDSEEMKLQKSAKLAKASLEQPYLDLEIRAQNSDEAKILKVKDSAPSRGSSAVSSMGIMKRIGLVKSTKHEKSETLENKGERIRREKMLFPYEEFVKFFQYEYLNVSPRGLINCGNSCYANAVLQCLTCTKPLTVYLLHRYHSKACCAKDWCLMCELEHYVMKLRGNGGALSPSGILLHMRRINSQIGDGSQEDAHEFLRLLVASMQAICLESLGGENVVDLRSQETTFIQHTFGGRLKSKVKCLRCHHESERYENIMDLTLEIFGRVESLEDALTQYTSPEDLDGENMYRCGRCQAYVRARKQLSIQEAPNILTIVLKRFQEGSYGKINKWITFPEMLDMVPFMTGTDDIPPLYTLYAVVVHLDTLNASFSGHYISYVKDPRGNWFRIDDTEVQPVATSQVMSEGAYILFYMRSFPRPVGSPNRKTSKHQSPRVPLHCSSKIQKFPKPDQIRLVERTCTADPSLGHRSRAEAERIFPASRVLSSANKNRSSTERLHGHFMSMEFQDATSSDYSLFTSSDEASFTTESTRDSFSTSDFADTNNIDTISSIFNTVYVPEYSSSRTVSCSMFSTSKPQTRFFPEARGYAVDSDPANEPRNGVHNIGDYPEKHVFSQAFVSENSFGVQGNYGNDLRIVSS